MYESDFSVGTEFPVLIDTDIEFGRVDSLSYRLTSITRDNLLCGEFVSGGFRFTDLNNSLIYKLTGADRFSTLLIDGERVLKKDSDGLKDIEFLIKVPIEYTENSIPKPVNEMGIFSAPVSILGVRLIGVPISGIQIGKHYSFKAKNILFLGQHENNKFRFSLT